MIMESQYRRQAMQALKGAEFANEGRQKPKVRRRHNRIHHFFTVFFSITRINGQ
ncbi:hypothetical protein [Tuberibacillus sp. Marseille-P3662]|uniref:hypothetical protein n=1 Tax=Tuberibacillus sp. Marseille-P3662 TaxID=1965358 RepID=UPI00159448B4|nr:hypothetical protein [Tuberibacillus sp. Marseille-P3662]